MTIAKKKPEPKAMSEAKVAKPKRASKPKVVDHFLVPPGGELIQSSTGERLGFIHAYTETYDDKEWTFYRGFIFTGVGQEKVFETSADRSYAIKKVQTAYNKHHNIYHSGAHVTSGQQATG